jgi:hypothetical protein
LKHPCDAPMRRPHATSSRPSPPPPCASSGPPRQPTGPNAHPDGVGGPPPFRAWYAQRAAHSCCCSVAARSAGWLLLRLSSPTCCLPAVSLSACACSSGPLPRPAPPPNPSAPPHRAALALSSPCSPFITACAAPIFTGRHHRLHREPPQPGAFRGPRQRRAALPVNPQARRRPRRGRTALAVRVACAAGRARVGPPLEHGARGGAAGACPGGGGGYSLSEARGRPD